MNYVLLALAVMLGLLALYSLSLITRAAFGRGRFGSAWGPILWAASVAITGTSAFWLFTVAVTV